MSVDLYWEPVRTIRPRTLPDPLKRALYARLWDGEGTNESRTLGVGWLEYLHGLKDAGVTGAHALMNAIAKHGSVRVWIGE